VARITHGSTATRLEYYPAASPSGAPATNYVVQYRTATVNANGTYSATGSWITVDKDDHTTTYYTITGLQAAQAYLFRVAAEGSAGIGPFHYPRGAVTVNSLAAMPNNVTSPSGAFLVNAPAGWSQPTNNDPYAAGRWFSFTRPGIITFTVTTGVTDAMVIAYNTSGEQLGIVTQSSGTSQSHRLCFFASPGTRYVVHHGGVELTVQSLVVAGGVMRVVDYTVGSTPDATPFFLSPAWPANSRSQNTLHLALGALTGVAGNSDDVWIQATAQGYLTIAIASTGTTPNHMVWRGTASVPRDQLVGFDDKAAVYVIQNVGVGDRITISGQTGSQPSNMSISVRFSPEPCVNLPPVNNWP